MGRIWEQLPKESPRAFEAFKSYRDMGPARSTARVGEVIGKSKRQIEKWSSTHKWVERVRSYDQYLDSQGTAQAEKRVREMRDKHIKLASMAQKKVADALRERLANPTKHPLTNSELIRWLEVTAKLEALAIGEPTGDETVVNVALSQSVEAVLKALEPEGLEVTDRVIKRLLSAKVDPK